MHYRKADFANMLEACSSTIIKLCDEARTGSAGVSEADFKKFLTMSLFSLIWYPTRRPNEEQLAERIELRMWAKAVTKMDVKQAMFSDIRGMAKRLGKLKVARNPLIPAIGGETFDLDNLGQSSCFSKSLLP